MKKRNKIFILLSFTFFLFDGSDLFQRNQLVKQFDMKPLAVIFARRFFFFTNTHYQVRVRKEEYRCVVTIIEEEKTIKKETKCVSIVKPSRTCILAYKGVHTYTIFFITNHC